MSGDLDDAFLESEVKIGNLKLRPFTIGSMTACRRLGLSLFTGEGQDLTPDEIQRQVLSFAWIQSAPLQKVLKAFRDGTAAEQIDAFEWEISPTDLKKIESEIERISRLTNAAAIDIVQRSGASDPDEPGNS